MGFCGCPHCNVFFAACGGERGVCYSFGLAYEPSVGGKGLLL